MPEKYRNVSVSRLERKWFEGKMICVEKLVMRRKDCPVVEMSSSPDPGKGAREAETIWMDLWDL